jgi:hypothetical protein
MPAVASLDYRALLSRILQTVDQCAYLTPTNHIDPGQRDAMRRVEKAIQASNFDPEAVRVLIRRLHQEGQIDRVMMLSALHVVAAHPAVKDYAEAARLTGEQEFAALSLGGPNLSNNLASIDRHRGVLAWIMGNSSVALDHFVRAMERQHTVENLGNVLCALLRLSQMEEAMNLVQRVRATHPPSFVAELNQRIQQDPDLSLLAASEIA